ncbi:ATP-binding protein [Syntrophomonas palmitatica]|uniref:ATP-binding protein n=1 Tax=Syntrophomonas palmitatica TaxID=402877 RepID=UPI0006D2548E|nr:AAA family ATPase [Syntrophomonas palmitatica]
MFEIIHLGLSTVLDFIYQRSWLLFVIIVAGVLWYFMKASEPPKQNEQHLTMKQSVKEPSCDIGNQIVNNDPHAFDRLIGLEKAKREVQDFFDIMKTYATNPKLANKYELKPPKGLLLYGPPGNGKTSFARACAQFYGFSFIPVKGSALLAGDGAVGVPQQRIKTLFKEARLRQPCIVFFDEIDAIAQVRSGRSINSPSDIILDSLLNEIDGFNPLEGVFIMAATNRKDILDPAIIRPGRLEKHIEIGNPEFNDRVAILKAHIGKKPIENDIDFYKLASWTEGKSGAFLETVVNIANTNAFRERRSITQTDLENAVIELETVQNKF